MFQFTAAFGSGMNYRIDFYLNSSGVSQIGFTYSVGTTPARAFHAVWQAARCYQYDYCIVKMTDSSAGDTIVEQRFDIVRLCNNPTIIKYLNPFGCFETFAFEGRTPRSNQYESTGRYEARPTTANPISTGRNLRVRQFPQVEVSQDALSLEEAIALEDLVTSPTILLYVGDFTEGQDADDWIECNIDIGSYRSYDTYNSLHRVEFTLNLNEVYTLRN
jgi:hypothetical protein